MFRYLIYASVLIAAATIMYFKLSGTYPDDEATLTKGKELYSKHCLSCHALNADGIGPRLGGVTNLLSENDLADFIKNPAKVIEAGNERAINLTARYKQTMPAFEWLKVDELGSILSYIHHQTELRNIEPLIVNKNTGLTGRLVAPVEKSSLKIEMEEVVQIPRMKDKSPDLGLATLRPHPSGDGTLFASDQHGIIYRISRGKAETFLDIREHIKDFQSGPGIATGLGSFDFHPDFLTNGLIYITHAETFKGQTPDYVISDSIKAEVQWIIGEWKMENAIGKIFKGTHSEMLRLHAPTFGHGCQDISFIPGLGKNHKEYGLLYFGFGDGGSNNIKRPEMAHHVKSFLGCILRIDPAGRNSKNGKYGIPSDNPFVNEPDPRTVKEIYAYGFRNPHRLAWDANNGNRMLATDIGESNIEELNIIEKGGDYGWPGTEGNFGIATKKDLKTVFRLKPGEVGPYKKPFAQYDHEDGKAISGGSLYEGDIAALKNKYVFGDIVNGKLFYVNIDPLLSDSSIYEFTIMQNEKETTLQELSASKRLHLRVFYDRFGKDLYVITKVDGRIRRVKKVYE
jgi:glucose/arabinose dehydrogenase/mono/diheme cytochrome c family protein